MTINFNTDPYYDDYSELKDFYRILFRPGFAVQARELTQIQSILQNQVSRIGNHFFKNGSQIIPGSVNVDNQVHFAKLETTQDAVEVTTYLSQFQNKIIKGATSGVTAVVLDSSECNCVVDGTIPTLYFKYESTADDGETKRFVPGEELIAYAADNTAANNYRLTADQSTDLTVTIQAPVGNTTYTNNPDTDVIGKGFVVEVKEGIYYIDGIFVRNDELHLYIGRFSNNPTARVGFKVVETFTTPETDTSLLDPAQGSYNYTAPGAHRYEIDLQLTELDETSSGADGIKFIELIRIKDGNVQHKVDKTAYAELEKTLARRTNDLAGSYEVNKFKLSKREHLDDGSNFGVYAAPDGDVDKLVAVVDPGKAYVEGYEVEATAATFLDIDKARGTDHIDRISDIPVGTSVGNYVIIDNVKGGYADISTFETIDLVSHYTTLGSNNLAGTTTQIVGTARIKAFEWHSGDYGSNPQYKVGLFDIQMKSGKSFVDDVRGIRRQDTAGTATFGGNIVPDNDTAYITGTATNDPTDSGTGGTTIQGTGTLFLGEVNVDDVLVIDGTVAGVVSAIDANNDITVTGNTTTALEGRVQVLRAVLNDPEYPNLVYPVGYQFVETLHESDGTRQATLYVRREITETSNGSGQWSHTLTNANETYLSDQDLENYSLFNESTGAIIDIDSGDISFDSDSNRKTVYIDGLSNSTQYTLLTTIRQTSTTGAEKTKTLTEDYEQEITGKKTVTAERITLDKADVLRVTDIRMTPGDFDTYDNTNSVSILDNYTVDDGQKPTHYDAASLVLKAGRKVPTGAIQVTMDYFTHSASGNYFSVDSYTRPDNPSVGIDYEDIPSTVLENGETVRLSDVIDFRPILGGTNNSYNELPAIGTDVETSVAYYLSRVDKIVLTSLGEFKVIQGVPALNPREPNDPKTGMVLATMFVPPYTLDIADTKLYQRDNRRYTMKELGKIERRMASIEEYVALDKLEKLTADLQIIDPETGIDKFKNGFITDQFGGHSLGDVKKSDYRASVDPANKQLRPMHFTTALDIIEDISSQAERVAADWQKTGDVLSLPYTETSMIYNPYASRTIDVNPYKIGAFKGEITLNPEGDNWKDTDRRPDLVVTDDNGYDAIKFLADELGVTGAQWNEWETNWTGSSSTTRTWQTGDPNLRRQTVTGYEETITTETGTASRTGIDTQLSGVVNAQDYGDRVVDLSYIPYMRARPVVFTAKNLKADTKFFPFFDDKDVSSYITPAQIFNVSNSSASSYMDFNPVNLQNGVVTDVYERTENGKVEPAYAVGDIIKNTTHTATEISAIAATANDDEISVTVGDTSGISPGHHVILYNLDVTREITSSLVDNLEIPESTISDYTKNTSKQLNLLRFKVTSVDSGTNVIVLETLDGSDVPTFDAYDATAYTSPDAGKLLRLQASGVVAFEGVLDDETDANGSSRELHVVNVKNGFAVGETVTGVITTANSQVNSVDIDSINGSTSQIEAPTIKTSSTDLRTDAWGTVVGTFHIPNNSTQAFRTGERTFKLIDNRTNNDADFDSKGSAVYYSTGISLAKERTVVNSRDVRFVQDRLYEDMPVRRTSTSQRVLYSYYTGHDPVAQTFTVSSTGGAMVTSVDVFFSEAGNRPITVEIRTTNNGVPSTKIIPFSIVTKTPQQISTSDDGSVATTFNFDAPIYLQDGETYALVVKTDEPGCRFFISEVGQTDLVTGNVITSQPLTGSLYLSQNSLEFEINPLYDMKFNLRKAVFSPTTATIDLKTAIPEAMSLAANPFTMATGTNKVRVNASNHGFKATETVVISGVADGVYGADGTNGFPADIINGAHTVTATGLDKDSFIIELDTTDGNGDSLIVGALSNIIKGEYGGSGVQITRQLDMDIFYLKSGEVSVKDTDITYKINAPSYGVNTFKSLVADSNYEFAARESIKSYENQTIVSASPLVKRSSVRLQAIMSTTNQNVSPLLDLQKMSGYVIANVINSASQSDVNVLELDSTTLLETSVVEQADTRESGTGTITTTTSSTAVTASGGAFESQVQVGDYLYDSSSNLIGEVETITDDDNIVLIANAAVAVTGDTYTVQNNNHIVFYNSGGKGIIRSSLDTADNLLANATIGSWLYISNLSTHLNGYHEIEDILIETADSGFAGNTDNDRITLTLAGEFPIDKTFALDLVQDHVDFAGTGTITTTTSSTAVTGGSSSFNSELIVGQKLIASDGTELGTIATIVSDTSATLEENAAAAVTGDTYKVRFESSTYEINKLDKFVADYAPANSYNYANYITRPLLLNEPADSIKIKFDAEIPVSADIDVYYRTGTGTESLATKKFINTGFANTTTNPDGEFTEREIDLVDIAPYTKIAIKIVMKSTNTVNVPKVKNLRLIAYS